MARDEWQVCSGAPGGLNLTMDIARTHTSPGTAARLFRRTVPVVAASLLAIGLVLLLSGFSQVPAGTARSDIPTSENRIDVWQELVEGVVRRANEFQVQAELGDGESSAKIAIETPLAFENNKDRLKPDYAGFLLGIAAVVQMNPATRLIVTGFGNTPATKYNPFLLGRRVRAVQVFFAENGIPIDRIEAKVQEADDYDGPNTLLSKASSGQVITIHFMRT